MVEDLLFERGIDICHVWWNQFGPMFADENQNRRGFGAGMCRSGRPADYHNRVKDSPVNIHCYLYGSTSY
jgi:hypothetical protein